MRGAYDGHGVKEFCQYQSGELNGYNIVETSREQKSSQVHDEGSLDDSLDD